jgi:hypothetical protein
MRHAAENTQSNKKVLRSVLTAPSKILDFA